jgi:hypothetical protein
MILIYYVKQAEEAHGRKGTAGPMVGCISSVESGGSFSSILSASYYWLSKG